MARNMAEHRSSTMKVHNQVLVTFNAQEENKHKKGLRSPWKHKKKSFLKDFKQQGGRRAAFFGQRGKGAMY